MIDKFAERGLRSLGVAYQVYDFIKTLSMIINLGNVVAYIPFSVWSSGFHFLLYVGSARRN